MRIIDADELVKYLKKYHSMSQGVISDVEHFPTSQIPNRTLYKHLGTHYTHFGIVRHDKFMCCNCGIRKDFVDGHTAQYKYCQGCGLKIDWSYEE